MLMPASASPTPVKLFLYNNFARLCIQSTCSSYFGGSNMYQGFGLNILNIK